MDENKNENKPPQAPKWLGYVGIVPILLLFIGGYMAISNGGKNTRDFWVYIGMAITGFLGICIYAVVLVMYKKKEDKYNEEHGIVEEEKEENKEEKNN